MKRLKVLVSSYACNPLGSPKLHPGEDLTGWRMVHQIARFHDVHVLTHSYNEAAIAEAGAGRSSETITFHFTRLPRPLRWLYKIEFGQRIYYYLWQIHVWRKARRLHREVGFDLAHHLTFGNDWLSSYMGAFLPVPFILGPVGGGQRTPRGLMREYTFGGRLSEWGRIGAQWVGRRDPVRRRCMGKARAILVCNRETMTKVPKRYRDKVVYFPVNGVSSDDFAPAAASAAPPAGGEKRPFRAFMAGRFHRLKGFALAVRGFGLFAAGHPDVEFVVIGKGHEGGGIRRVIEELGLGTKVRLIDWLPRAELLKEMRASDVLLFPSFRDGGGAVVVEAMASGKAVIGLNSGGPGFHIEPGWGFKIEPRDPATVAAEIARALETLYGDRSLVRAMGEAARRRAEDFYLWDRHGERFRAIYDKALGGEGAGA